MTPVLNTHQIKKKSSQGSSDDCQLLVKSSEKSTKYNTNAPSSANDSLMDIGEDEEEKFERDLMTPYPDFDWQKAVYPESNVVDLPVEQNGKTIHLKAYRWPPKNERKAVVFYIHGYGSFVNHNAVYGKYLAEDDFEVFGVDQRGFGESEGERAQIDCADDIYAD